ncbi:cytidine deaminase [Heliorestis acidaminivorans]|uniref:Cytidine deaminase n=1 Tax=Heliorestis acidaminivorans TaxID=553427 RepID=A0A6I0ERV8_9FIRM|nr:cytidine deaminase [Heliorestis acidaminivorans]
MDEKLIEDSITLARLMRDRAYVPYSHFPVGAVLAGDNGQLYGGCNVENSSFGLTNCAERTALFRAVAEGCKSFQLLVLTTVRKEAVTPCGACRQVLTEFAKELPVLYVNDDGERVWMDLTVLFPQAFALLDSNEKKEKSD